MINHAVRFALRAHGMQLRKGSEVPYISHPVTVGLHLAKTGCNDDIVSAGILHDTVEDTAVTLADISREFGERVSAIVEGCSEPHRSWPWKERKQHTIKLMSCPNTDIAIKLVTCADKLENIRSIAEDYRAVGDEVWKRFNAGRECQRWYYTSLVNALSTLKDDPRGCHIYHQFEQAVQEVFGQ